MREHAHPVPDRRSARPDPEVTSALVAAVSAQHPVRISYRTAAGNPRSFEVDPWSLVVRFGRWYLLCLAHHADSVRTFRVDRISGVEALEGTFEVPVDLDPARELESNLGKGWEYDTRVVFHAPISDVAPWVRPAMGDLSALDDGHCVLVGSTQNAQAYVGEWLAGVPLDFVVEGGEELRAATVEVAQRLARSVERVE